MGKPFIKEIERIHETLDWVNSLDLSELTKKITQNISRPLIIVGSGGSLSACHFAVSLAQGRGQFAKAMTPLEFYSAKSIINNSTVLFLSASGKNNDIKFAFSLAIEQEAKEIISLTMNTNSPLGKESAKYNISTCFDFDIPIGKDGFLATNSLISFFSILYRVFAGAKQISFDKIEQDFLDKIDVFLSLISPDYSLVVLYSGWSQAVAFDIESKCTEAALINILMSDYRNFGHGRHHWLDKRGRKSAILAIETESDKELVSKTIELIPESIPRFLLKSIGTTQHVAIDLLIKSFFFIHKLGQIQGIDPGRPGVPEFGRKLYNLRFSNLFKERSLKQIDFAVRRKLEVQPISHHRTEEYELWSVHCKNYLRKIQKGKFGAIVFDYDGTICSDKNRYLQGISKDITTYLIEILKSDFIIGIATGRGKSVRISLQQALPEELWNSVIIGYYNGGQIGKLSDITIPNKNIRPDQLLIDVNHELMKAPKFHELSMELRPHQLTIETLDSIDWRKIKSQLQNEIIRLNIGQLRILESSHSIDIIPNYITKIKVVEECIKYQKVMGLGEDVLCIGDRGHWPGNDYQLLDTDYSLSVDEVSSNHENCWNFSKPGMKNTDSTLFYLSKVIRNGRFMKVKF